MDLQLSDEDDAQLGEARLEHLGKAAEEFQKLVSVLSGDTVTEANSESPYKSQDFSHRTSSSSNCSCGSIQAWSGSSLVDPVSREFPSYSRISAWQSVGDESSRESCALLSNMTEDEQCESSRGSEACVFDPSWNWPGRPPVSEDERLDTKFMPPLQLKTLQQPQFSEVNGESTGSDSDRSDVHPTRVIEDRMQFHELHEHHERELCQLRARHYGEIDQLELKLQRHQQELEEMRVNTVNDAEQAVHFQTLLQQREQNIRTLHLQLESVDYNRRDLCSTISQLHGEVKHAQEKLTGSEKACHQLQLMLAQHEEESSRLEKSLAQSSHASLEQNIRDLRLQVSGADDQNEELAAIIVRRDDELQHAQQGFASSEMQCGDLRSQHEVAEQSMRRLQMQVCSADRNNEELSAMITKRDAEASHFHTGLESSELECHQLRTALAAHEASEQHIESLQSQIVGADLINGELSAMISQRNGVVKHVQESLTGSEMECQQLRTSLARFEEESAPLQEVLAQKSNAPDTEQTLRMLQEQNEELQARHEAHVRVTGDELQSSAARLQWAADQSMASLAGKDAEIMTLVEELGSLQMSLQECELELKMSAVQRGATPSGRTGSRQGRKSSKPAGLRHLDELYSRDPSTSASDVTLIQAKRCYTNLPRISATS